MPGKATAASWNGPPRSFVLDDEVYEVEGGRWDVLLELLTERADWQLPLLFELLQEDDLDALLDRLADDEDPLTDWGLTRIGPQLVAAACGRPWWTVGSLLGYADTYWGELDGALLMTGVDLRELLRDQPARACNVITAWLFKDADPKERAKLEAQLNKPPAGIDVQENPLWTPEEEGAAFMAASSALRGMRKGPPADQ